MTDTPRTDRTDRTARPPKRRVRILSRLALPLLCAGALVRCGEPAEAPEPVAETQQATTTTLTRTLRSIDVSPDNVLLKVDLNKQGTRTFKVVARYSDRSTADVTASAVLTLDTPSVGTLYGARFESNIRTSPQVGFARVTARYKEGGIEAVVSTGLTVAWLRTSGASKDLVFVLPPGGAADSETLSFSTNVQSVDAFFAVDTTGSMGAPITVLRDSLQTVILPAVRASAVKDAWLGVGAIDDFPVAGFGSPDCGPDGDDQPFILLSAMSSDPMAAQSGVNSLLRGGFPRGCGSDTPEGQMEALYQIATGAGNVVPGVVNVPPHRDKGRGGVEFRAGSLPVVTLVSDAAFHTKGEGGAKSCYGQPLDYSGAAATAAHTRTETTTALKNICARVVGVSIVNGVTDAECLATADMTQMAQDTGALVPPQAWDPLGRPAGCAAGQCCTGIAGAGEAPNAAGLCPLVFKAPSSGVGIGAQVAAGITQLARYAAFDTGTGKTGLAASDDGTPLPAGKTTADFLTSVKALDATLPTLPPGLKPPVASGDKFTGVTPGSTVRFTIEAKNDFLPAGPKPQSFHAKLQVLASGCANLDERDVLFIVPAAP